MKKDVFLDLFIQFLESVSVTPELNNHTYLNRVYGRNNAFIGWTAEPISKVITEIRKHYPRISEKTIHNLFQSAVVELFEESFIDEDGDPELIVKIESLLPELAQNDIALKAMGLLESLETQIKNFVIFVPLQGIELKLPQYEIANGVIYPIDSLELNNRLNITIFPDELKKDILNRYKDCSAYYMCTQSGNQKMAAEFAREQARLAIQLLRFYLTKDSLKNQHKYHQIRLVDDPESDDVFVFLYQPVDNKEDKVEGHWSQSLGPFYTYKLTHDLTEYMDENGLELIQKAILYSGSNTGNIHARLKRSIRWFSYAVSAYEVDQKFISFAVALESLLTDQIKVDPMQSWGGITQKLAERCAFLLSEDFEERICIAKNIRELYGMRSSAVHGGLPVSPENVERIQVLTRRVILAFVAKDFENWNNFTEWIKKRKYGGSSDPIA